MHVENRLTMHQIDSPDDLERLRQLRNSGRLWMTRSTEYITPEQQREWWHSHPHLHDQIRLFRNEQGVTVGYGLLNDHDGRMWISLVVDPSYRSQGYGTEIYRSMATRHDGEVWAEIRDDNTPSLIAALRAGYMLAEKRNSLVWLVCRMAEESAS